MDRRHFLLSASTLPLAACGWSGKTQSVAQSGPQADSPAQWLERLALLEKDLQGRLGVFALDTGSGRQLAFRADERFPFCSTFKMMLSAAILSRSAGEAGLMERRIAYTRDDLVTYSPITEKHAGTGMTIAELCAAAMQHSDNTAANLLIDLLGSPATVTGFARSIGDTQFRLDRRETELNSALPGDPRDTTTPKAMGLSLRKLVLEDGLPAAQRERLADWLKGNTTGNARIRAGVPKEWTVGDKTGTGDYGSASDIAVLWRPGSMPAVLSVYTTRMARNADGRNDTIASAAAIAADWLAEGESFREINLS